MADATIKHLIGEVRESSALERDKMELIRDSVKELADNFGMFFKHEKNKELDEAEERRKSKSRRDGIAAVHAEGAGAFRESMSLGFVGMLAALVSATTGFMTGVVSVWKDVVASITKISFKAVRFIAAPLIDTWMVFYKNLFKGIGILAKTASLVLLDKMPLQFRFFMLRISDVLASTFGTLSQGIMNAAKPIGRTLGGLPLQIREAAANLSAAFKMGLMGIGVGIRDVSGRFMKLTFFEDAAKEAGSFVRSVGKAAAGLVMTVRKVGFAEFIDDMSGLFSFLGREAGKIGKLFRSMDVFGFAKMFTKMFSLFKLFGRYVAWPITFIIGIVDAVKGWREGFEKTGNSLIGGAVGALSGLLKGFIGMPFDMLKNVVGWAAGKMRVEGVRDFLSGFSFTDLIGRLFDSVSDAVLGFIDAMKDETGKFNFMKITKAIVGTLWNVLTLPFRAILDGLAELVEKIPGIGDGFAENIRGFANKIRFGEIDESIRNREESRKRFEREKMEGLSKTKETPRDVVTKNLQSEKTMTTINNRNAAPVVINQVDASTKDMSVRTSASTAFVGEPTPPFDFSNGNRVAYV